MKLSVFYDHILQAAEQSGKPVTEILQEVRTAGVEAVEISLPSLSESEQTCKLLRDANVNISCVYEFFAMESCDETQKIHELLETAVQVQAGKVLIVPGFVSPQEEEVMQACMKDYEKLSAYMESNDKILRMVQGLSYAARLGAERGITVTVEDFDDNKSPLSGMNGVRWFLNRIPELQYTLDMGNFVGNEEDVFMAWELLQDRIAHVHCKDRGEEPHRLQTGKNGKLSINRGLASVAAGDGYLPIGELVRRLREIGYDDYLAIEHFDAPNQELCIRRSAEFLQKQ